MTVDPGVWEFTVFACKATETLTAGTEAANAVLIGYGTADLTRYSGSTSITLSAGTLKRTANVTLKIDPSPWFDETEVNIKAGLYRLSDNTLVDPTYETIFSSVTPATSQVPLPTGGYEFNLANVTPGNYNFRVECDKTIEGLYSSFVWSDILTVEPGNDFTETITIPNMFGNKPAAPENFTAYYADPDKAGGIDAKGAYTLAFAWEDKSNNEQNFIIEVADVTNLATPLSALPTSDATWPTVEDDKKMVFSADGWSNPKRIGGSTMANNTKFAIQADLGKKYVARIKAISKGGQSDWVYVTKAATAPTPANLPENVTNAGVFAAATGAEPTLNLYRITYALGGGSYTKTAGGSSNEDIVVYASSGSVKYLTVTPTITNGITTANTISDENTTTPTTIGTNLKKGDGFFTSWRTVSTDKTTNIDLNTTPTYDGTDNVMIFAAYESGLSGTVTIQDRKAYNLLPAWITCESNDTGNSSPAFDPITVISIAKSFGNTTPKTATTLTFKIAPVAQTAPSPITSDFKYDDVTLTIVDAMGNKIYSETKQNVAVGSTTTFTPIDISGYDEDSYMATFTARYGQISPNQSFPFIITN